MSLHAEVGTKLPERIFKPDNVQSMLYNAVLWNGHRIHFDEPYARDVEGYPGLVVPGPLLGDWLHQVVEEWLDDQGRICGIEYSNRVASFVGETLTAGGEVTAVTDSGRLTISVYVKNENGDVITPGVITAELNH